MTKLLHSPDPNHFDAIRQLIDQSCTNQALADEAYTSICDAIRNYVQCAAPLVDGRYRQPASTTAITRNELQAIKKHAKGLHEALQSMSVGTLSTLSAALDGPVGQVSRHLVQLSEVIDSAINAAGELDDKPSDHHRIVMAAAIATVFKNAGLPVAHTAPNQAITGQRQGALYGRVLQEACHAAGLTSVSLGPLIKAGIELMSTHLP